MKSEDIKHIDELIEFMDAEAEKWGRQASPQVTVTGKGIKEQWELAKEFPHAVFYMEGVDDGICEDTGGKRINFFMKKMWFTKEGNVTERPADLGSKSL